MDYQSPMIHDMVPAPDQLDLELELLQTTVALIHTRRELWRTQRQLAYVQDQLETMYRFGLTPR